MVVCVRRVRASIACTYTCSASADQRRSLTLLTHQISYTRELHVKVQAVSMTCIPCRSNLPSLQSLPPRCTSLCNYRASPCRVTLLGTPPEQRVYSSSVSRKFADRPHRVPFRVALSTDAPAGLFFSLQLFASALTTPCGRRAAGHTCQVVRPVCMYILSAARHGLYAR